MLVKIQASFAYKHLSYTANRKPLTDKKHTRILPQYGFYNGISIYSLYVLVTAIEKLKNCLKTRDATTSVKIDIFRISVGFNALQHFKISICYNFWPHAYPMTLIA